MNLLRVSHDDWIKACKECRAPSVYLDPRWLQLIEQVYPRLQVIRLVCRDDAGIISWLLPLVKIVPLGGRKPMLISLPFGNYGGFLMPAGADTLNEELLAPLYDFFYDSDAFALELRETEEPTCGFEISDTFQRFELMLPDTAEELWKNVVSGNARTCVRKAEKNGVEAVFHHTEDPVTVFQMLYEKNASQHGTPTHHLNWYYKLAELFDRESEIVLGKIGNQFVGALFILHYQGRAVLHAAVNDPMYRTVPVTDKLLWAFFEKVIARKTSRVFDFGRTRPEPGKLFFKKKWGGMQKPLYYSYLVKQGEKVPRILPENPKFGLASRLWRYLPMPVKRVAGPYLRARIPT